MLQLTISTGTMFTYKIFIPGDDPEEGIEWFAETINPLMKKHLADMSKVNSRNLVTYSPDEILGYLFDNYTDPFEGYHAINGGEYYCDEVVAIDDSTKQQAIDWVLAGSDIWDCDTLDIIVKSIEDEEQFLKLIYIM